MAQPPATQFSGIFISYRRADSQSAAGRLFDNLTNHFDEEQIFMDVDNIELGDDFVKAIENAVGSCEIVVAVMGPHWLSSRLDDPHDFVRLEIATALKRDILLIPVLVQGATMPSPQDLPEDIRLFSRRNALEISHTRWRSDVARLITALEKALAARKEARLAAAEQAEAERQRRQDEEKRQTEEERQRRLAEEEQTKQRVAEDERRLKEESERNALEEKRLAEEVERKRIAEEVERQRRVLAEAKRAEEEKREEDERRQREAAASKQRREDEARQENEPQAEESRASEARFRELNLAAANHLLDKVSTEVTPGDVSTPVYKNRRIVLIAAASVSLLAVTVWLIWQSQGSGNSSASLNQSPAAKPSPIRVPDLIYIPPGEFMMGSKNGEGDEKPEHRVVFAEGFYMGKYEVTQAQWQDVMGNNPSKFKGDNLPVHGVSWNDAQDFIRRLNARGDGFIYHLPTEAEWEYGARAGTNTKYYWGDNVHQACRYANVQDLTGRHVSLEAVQCRDGYEDVAPAGSLQPNAFGLYDMVGNVTEWCEDYFHESYSGAPTDGTAWLSGGDLSRRILRGSAWYGSADVIRLSHRGRNTPEDRYQGYGFRVAAVARK